MSDYAHDDPTGPPSVGGADTVGDVGNGVPAADDANRAQPDADPETDPATDWS